jgi:hypothetical protein
VIVFSAVTLLAQSRDTLETKVTGEASAIVFQWSKKHPWDINLQSGKAFLAAEYKTENGRVELDCLDPAAAAVTSTAARYRGRVAAGCSGQLGVTIGGKDNRTLRFKLPDELTGVPAGQVCLFLRLPDQKTIPIRKANQSGDDTSRFQYPEWSEQAARRAQVTAARSKVAALEGAVERSKKNVEAQEQINRGRGWIDAAACQSAKAPNLDMMEGTKPVAPPAKHEELARRVCVLQVANAMLEMQAMMKRLRADGKLTGDPAVEDPIQAVEGFTGRSGAHYNYVHPPGLLSFILDKLPAIRSDERYATRLAQLNQFSLDWKTYVGTLSAYLKEFPEPHFGEADKTLDLQTETVNVGRRIAAALREGKDPIAVDLRGFVGASLESWNRCVVEGKAQLETTYQRMVQLRAKTPVLQEAVRRETVQACQSGVTKLAQLKETLADFERQSQQARNTVDAAAAIQPRAKQSQQQNLNQTGCSAQ